jgi:hypothetical protein
VYHRWCAVGADASQQRQRLSGTGSSTDDLGIAAADQTSLQQQILHFYARSLNTNKLVSCAT